MYYYVFITTNYHNKSYKLSTTIIYRKMTNNDGIKQFQKTFRDDDTIKGSLMASKQFKKCHNDDTKKSKKVP